MSKVIFQFLGFLNAFVEMDAGGIEKNINLMLFESNAQISVNTLAENNECLQCLLEVVKSCHFATFTFHYLFMPNTSDIDLY